MGYIGKNIPEYGKEKKRKFRNIAGKRKSPEYRRKSNILQHHMDIKIPNYRRESNFDPPSLASYK